MTEDEFRKQVNAKGYGAPRIREFAPNLTSDMHTHDFAVFGLVTRGTLTLGFSDGSEAAHAAGECCELSAGTVHSERTGSDGATFLVATRQPATQIVHVTAQRPFRLESLYAPVWITGRLTSEQASRALSFVDGQADIATGYAISAEAIERCE